MNFINLGETFDIQGIKIAVYTDSEGNDNPDTLAGIIVKTDVRTFFIASKTLVELSIDNLREIAEHME